MTQQRPQLDLFSDVRQALTLQAPEGRRVEEAITTTLGPSGAAASPIVEEEEAPPVVAPSSDIVLKISDARCTVPWRQPSTGSVGKLLIVDGRCLAEQCLHAPKLRERRTRRGEPCGIVHGFARGLCRLLGMFRPSHVAVYFDDPGQYVYRREIFAEYKPVDKPAEFWPQVAACYEIAEALGCFSGQRWSGLYDLEACDLVAATASLAPEDWTVVVSTTDSRLLQLAQRGGETLITCWRNGEQETALAEAACQRRLRVEPQQVADYLAIVGHPSDGIPGVRGLGVVAARQLVGKFGCLEAIAATVGTLVGKESLAALDGQRGAKRTTKLLRNGLDDMARSFQLVELWRDLDILSVDEMGGMECFERRALDVAALRQLVERYEAPALREIIGNEEIISVAHVEVVSREAATV